MTSISGVTPETPAPRKSRREVVASLPATARVHAHRTEPIERANPRARDVASRPPATSGVVTAIKPRTGRTRDNVHLQYGPDNEFRVRLTHRPQAWAVMCG